MTDFDIIVAGAGPAGLAFAASLAGTGLRIALADPQPAAILADPPDDGREIALTDRSMHMLQAMGAWQHIPADVIAPLRRMRVLNGPSDYAMQWGEGISSADPVGRFAPNHWLRRALHRVAAGQEGVTILPGAAVERVVPGGAGVAAHLSDGRALTARLAVAADTRRSRLREQAGIAATVHDYRQRMCVVLVEHERPHGEAATAWFEYGRTLVTLPLNGNRSSAIMTLPPDEASRLLALDDAALGAALTEMYRGRLGAMRPAGRRHAVPVVTAYARRFAAERFALLGDAAVAMHPTSAHGFNFGLLGQDALAAAIRQAPGDPGAPAVLHRYERRHRGETQFFFHAVETVMRLYAAGDSAPARAVRNAVLRVGNLPPFRALLTAGMRDAGLLR